MFGFFRHKKRLEKLESEIKGSFNEVKKDFESVGHWIKHFHRGHDEVSDAISEFKRELSMIKNDLEEVKEHISMSSFAEENKQLSKKSAVLDKQTAVQGVEEAVQTGVQTANFHEILT